MPLGAHDAVIAGDTITTLHINSEWRKFLSHAIGVYLDIGLRRASQSDLDDIDPLIGNLFDDFYTAESLALGVEYRQAIRTSAFSLPTSGEAKIVWQSGDQDVTNPDRLYAPITGVATIEVSFLVTSVSAATCNIRIMKNGSTALVRKKGDGSSVSHWINISITRRLVAGDYVEVIVQENGTASIDTAAGQAPIISMESAIEI